MTDDPRLTSLAKLVDLRAREVDRLGADMNTRRAIRNRYADTLTRLEQLCEGSGASGAPVKNGRDVAPSALVSPALSLNCAAYKQAVMKMADAHRVDLSLHDADTAVMQRALLAASRRHASLDRELERQRSGARRSRTVREQKAQDDVALQMWSRKRK
jgi:flagellar export protein FliJ